MLSCGQLIKLIKGIIWIIHTKQVACILQYFSITFLHNSHFQLWLQTWWKHKNVFPTNIQWPRFSMLWPCHVLFMDGARLFSEPMLTYCQLDPNITYFNEILFEIQIFSVKKTHLNMSAKWRPFCVFSSPASSDKGWFGVTKGATDLEDLPSSAPYILDATGYYKNGFYQDSTSEFWITIMQYAATVWWVSTIKLHC